MPVKLVGTWQFVQAAGAALGVAPEAAASLLEGGPQVGFTRLVIHDVGLGHRADLAVGHRPAGANVGEEA